MVAISELTLSRVTTSPLNRPTAPPKRMRGERRRARGCPVALVTSMPTTADKGERGADRQVDLRGDQQHGHARGDDQHQRALAQDGDDVGLGIELRRGDRDARCRARARIRPSTIWLLPASWPTTKRPGAEACVISLMVRSGRCQIAGADVSYLPPHLARRLPRREGMRPPTSSGRPRSSCTSPAAAAR